MAISGDAALINACGKKDEGADEYEYIPPDLADGVRGEWEVVKPTPKPTEEDLAIRSAEVDDDD